MNHRNIYNKIVERRKSNPSNNSYTEKHHIIPKCLGGDNSKENLVTVSTKEHYLLHHLLVKIYPENYKLKRAYIWIKTRLNTENVSSPYSCIRKCSYSKTNTVYYGKSHSEETKQKMSLSHKGKTFSEEHKQKISEAKKNERHPMYGKTHTDESKRKMSESLKGERNPNYGKTLSDEHRHKLSESFKGRIWVNNGIIQKQVFPNNIPEGFVKGRIKKVH